MARKSRTMVSRIGASQRTRVGAKQKVPTLILSGDWLKAIGFPVGAPLHLVSDRRGEMMLQRLGLRLPRTLKIVAKCQRPNALRRTFNSVGRRRVGD